MTLVLGLVGALALGLGGGGGLYYVLRGGTPDGSRLPPTRIADDAFQAPPQESDGVDQIISGVAAAGSTVIAAGSEYGGALGRARFVVSTDGGRTWTTSAVRTGQGGEPDGTAPGQVIGAPGAWLAFGGPPYRRTVWISKDGRSWTQLSSAAPAFDSNDEILQIASTSGGFLAVGYHKGSSDESDDDRAVLWTSSDGRSWERFAQERLNFPTDDGTPSQLEFVAARGAVVVVGGDVVETNDGDRTVAEGFWRSTDAGHTWESISVPGPGDGGGSVSGLASSDAGFFVLREAGNKGTVFASEDGLEWESAGEIAADGELDFEQLVGNDQGLATLATVDGDRSALYHSSDGQSWRTSDLGEKTDRFISDIAVAAEGVAVAGGARVGGDRDFYLGVADASGESREIDLRKVPDAVNPEHTVRGIGTADGRTVAVGSANGDAAAWSSVDRNAWTTTTPADSLGGEGHQQLTDTVHGPEGWLAVGEDDSRPLVVTSPDGRSWTRTTDDTFAPDEGAELTVSGVAHGRGGYVIVGREVSEDSQERSVVWRSSDLESWQRLDVSGLSDGPNAKHWMGDVSAGPFGYAASGAISDLSAPAGQQGRPGIWISPDGETWTAKRLPLPSGAANGYLTQVAVNGSTVVAMGQGESASGDIVFAVFSTDSGETWELGTLPSGVMDQGQRPYSSATALVPMAEGFAGVSMVGQSKHFDVVLWTSTNGRAWEARTPRGRGLSGRGSQLIHDLAVLDDELLGVGVTATSLSEHVTLWRTPLP